VLLRAIRIGASLASSSSSPIRKIFAYLVRMVVRDAEGQQITAQNGSIDAP
jgi:hypothetical protein